MTIATYPDSLDVVRIDESLAAWEQCIKDFLQAVYDRSGSSSSRVNYAYDLKMFLSGSANGGPPKHPGLYTKADVLWFINSPGSKGKAVSAGYRNIRLAHISSLYKFASGYSYTDSSGQEQSLMPPTRVHNPATGIRYAKTAKAFRTLSEHDLKSLFKAIPRDTVIGARDVSIYTAYLFLARRRAELCYMRVGDIERAVLRDDAGNTREGWRYSYTSKGKSRQKQYAEMPQVVYDAIYAYWLVSGRLATLTPASPVFIGHGYDIHDGVRKPCDPNKPLSPSAIFKNLRKYARHAGLDETKVCMHGLRHTAAFLRFLNGENLSALQRLLGHANIGHTQIYLEGLVGTVDDGADKLVARLGSL